MSTLEELVALPGNELVEIPDADFAAADNVDLLKQSDIVVTNPPFSNFRKYFKLLTDNGIDFLIVGNINAVQYKDVFYFIRDGIVYVDGSLKLFYDGSDTQPFGNVVWFSTLKPLDRKLLKLKNKYNSNNYQKLSNYDAILVNRTSEIPYDYDDVMAVPISYAQSHNQDQFEIVGITKKFDHKYTRSFVFFYQVGGKKHKDPFNRYENPILELDKPPEKGVYNTDGKTYLKAKYTRLLIKRRKPYTPVD